MRTLTYDCEIINDPNIHGWTNYGELGISVIGCHLDWVGDPFVMLDCRDARFLQAFQEIVNEADQVVGFNSYFFDDWLCAAHGVKVQTDFDLLCEIRILSGQPPEYVRGVTRGGYSLNAICLANGIGSKSGSGAAAPMWWKEGKYDRVIRYCKQDVFLTRSLYELYLERNIVDPTTGEQLFKEEADDDNDL
jgi:DEAD/DEAH box helicase domain-containing protein